MVERVWREILRGSYNPHRASFVSFASVVAHEALVAEWRYRHALMRWSEQAPTSFDALDGYEQPSWSFGADPLMIVLWREALREAIEALTAQELEAVNRYMAMAAVRIGSRGRKSMTVDSRTGDAMYRARRRVLPILEPV